MPEDAKRLRPGRKRVSRRTLRSTQRPGYADEAAFAKEGSQVDDLVPQRDACAKLLSISLAAKDRVGEILQRKVALRRIGRGKPTLDTRIVRAIKVHRIHPVDSGG